MATTSRPPAERSGRALGELLAVVVMIVLVALGARDIAVQNGAFTYAIDDAYIHLAMAERVAEDLTWGLRPGIVESASSSPGYTAVLAAATALPVSNQWLPLLLNLVGGAVLVVVVIRASGASSTRSRVLVGVTATFALALVPSSLLGMEVLPHAAVVACFVVALARHASGERLRAPWTLALLAALLVTLRLESAFLLAGAGLGLVLNGTGALRSRLRDPLAIAAGGLVSLGVMAALHVAGGQFPLPTSVVAKSRVAEDGDAALLRPLEDPVGAVEILGRNLTSNSRLMWAIAACLAAVALSGRRAAGVRTAAIAVLVAFVGQSWYGFTFTRYGEWLVTSGVVVAALALATLDGRQTGRRRAWTIWTAAALALALGQVTATEASTDAASSVHRQQEQMGRFLERYYPDQGAGVNDLGFVAWRHGGPLVDFLGLGSVDITRSRRDHDGVLLVDEMERIAEESGVEVVAVYRDPDRFFTRGLPDSWEPVLDWCLEGSTGVAGDRCVTWFATTEGDAEELAANLEDFEASLPPGVTTEPADP